MGESPLSNKQVWILRMEAAKLAKEKVNVIETWEEQTDGTQIKRVCGWRIESIRRTLARPRISRESLGTERPSSSKLVLCTGPIGARTGKNIHP